MYTTNFSPTLCTVVINFLSESNGSSAILGYFSKLNLTIFPISIKAVSVGSPVKFPSSATFVSLQSISAWNRSLNSSLNSVIDSKSISSPFVNTFLTVILFCVKVPVLSEQITDALPSVSTAGSFFTIAFFLTILWTPIAKTIVDTAASPSGIAATASETAVINIESGSFP